MFHHNENKMKQKLTGSFHISFWQTVCHLHHWAFWVGAVIHRNAGPLPASDMRTVLRSKGKPALGVEGAVLRGESSPRPRGFSGFSVRNA